MKSKAIEQNLSLIFITLAAIFGASIPVAGKIAFEAFGPFTMTFLRFFSATLFLLPFVLKTRELSFRSFKHFMPVGIIGAINPILFFIALQFTQAAVTPLLYAAVPALSAIYLYFAENHKLNLKQLLGIVLGLFGVAAIILLPILGGQANFGMGFGNGLIFLASIAFMSYGILSKKKQTELKVSPTALTFYFALATLLISLPLVVWELNSVGFLGKVAWKHVVSGFYAGIFGTGALYLLYQYALKHGNAITASLFVYVQPVAGIVLSFLFLGETVSLPIIFAGGFAILGASLASSKK